VHRRVVGAADRAAVAGRESRGHVALAAAAAGHTDALRRAQDLADSVGRGGELQCPRGRVRRRAGRAGRGLDEQRGRRFGRRHLVGRLQPLDRQRRASDLERVAQVRGYRRASQSLRLPPPRRLVAATSR
jgi:hypothetical protein